MFRPIVFCYQSALCIVPPWAVAGLAPFKWTSILRSQGSRYLELMVAALVVSIFGDSHYAALLEWLPAAVMEHFHYIWLEARRTAL